MAAKKTIPVSVKAAKKVPAAVPAKKMAALPAKRPVKAVAEKPASKRELSDTDYRKLKKYTHVMLAEMITPEGAKEVRARIGSTRGGELRAEELVQFLAEREADLSPWKQRRLPNPDGTPKKRGRPRKDAAPVVAPPPRTKASAVLGKAAKGGVLPKKAAPPPAKAPAAPAAAPRKFFAKK